MRRSATGFVMVMGLILACGANAQTTAPSTAPAADQTTPQGTLILLSRAMQNGDAAAAKPLLQATTDKETALADLLVQSIDVNSHFKKAVAKAFGDGVADMFTGSAAEAADAEQHISQAKVKIDNNNASVEADPQADPVKLVQVDGKWKLAMAALGDVEMARTQQELKMRLDVLNAVTDEIGQGKYKTPEELSDALRGKLALAMLQASKSDQPASQPAVSMPMAP